MNKTLDLKLDRPPLSTHTGGGAACSPIRRGRGDRRADGAGQQQRRQGETFNLPRNGLKAANNPVKKISGWGDEAYAATVHFVVDMNSFAVRKGKVSVSIQSTADYDHVKKLMKAVLAKL